MELPLISVIIPVYKVEEYLDQCIRSVAEQTYQNLEIILVDDGSPDNCGAMCDAWAEKDSRIRVIHQKNAGAGAARNTGLDAAKGELIGFVDSDDYLHPDMYSHLYGMMQDDIDISECGIVMSDGEEEAMEDGDRHPTEVYDRHQAMALHIRDEKFRQTPPNKLYRRCVLGENRFPVGKLIDDEYFTYRLIGNARRLAHTDSQMYTYRQRVGSAMHRPYSLRNLASVQARAERLAYLQNRMPELVPEAARELYIFCLLVMQAVLANLKGSELAQARRILHETRINAKNLMGDPPKSLKKRILLAMSSISFEGTARLLTFLNRIHILE